MQEGMTTISRAKLAKLQRANQRQGEEIVALILKGHALRHEIATAEKTLMNVYMNPEYAQEIIERRYHHAVARVPKRFWSAAFQKWNQERKDLTREIQEEHLTS